MGVVHCAAISECITPRSRLPAHPLLPRLRGYGGGGVEQCRTDALDAYKEAVSSGCSRELQICSRRSCDGMHQPVQAHIRQSPSIDGGIGHGVPQLAEELWADGGRWERESWFSLRG